MTSLEWSPNGTRLLASGYDPFMGVWDAAGGDQPMTITTTDLDPWQPGGSGTPLLQVCDLSVEFRTEDGRVCAVDRVSLDARAGELLAVAASFATEMRIHGAPNSRITTAASYVA